MNETTSTSPDDERKALFKEIASIVNDIESIRSKIVNLHNQPEINLSADYDLLERLESRLRNLRKSGIYNADYQKNIALTNKEDSQRESERYEIREDIHSGSSSQLVQAYDKKLEREVILKKIRSSHVARPNLLNMLLAEAKAQAVFTGHSQYVVPIYDVFFDSNSIVVVMPFDKGFTSPIKLGTDLRLRIDNSLKGVKESDTMEIAKIKEIYQKFFLSTALTTDFVRKKILHNDIKSNNFITSENGKALLIDFGISNLVTPNRYGTYLYMSPERIACIDNPNDNYNEINDDIYALAITYFHFLTGFFPLDFDSNDHSEMISKLAKMRKNTSGLWDTASNKLTIVLNKLAIPKVTQDKIIDLFGKALGIDTHIPKITSNSKFIAFSNASDFAKQLAACFT